MPKSSATATLSARARRAVAARTSCSSTPQSSQYLATSIPLKTFAISSKPSVFFATQSFLYKASWMRIATIADKRNASEPGLTCKKKSARSAVSVRRTSTTTIERFGSLAISFNVVRACGKPCVCHGFLPIKKATSVFAMSPRTPVPNIFPLTQNSPVFSCASALERCLLPIAARNAEE